MNVIEDYLKTLINHQRKKSNLKKTLYSIQSVPRCEGDFFYNKESAFDKKKLTEREKVFLGLVR